MLFDITIALSRIKSHGFSLLSAVPYQLEQLKLSLEWTNTTEFHLLIEIKGQANTKLKQHIINLVSANQVTLKWN